MYYVLFTRIIIIICLKRLVIVRVKSGPEREWECEAAGQFVAVVEGAGTERRVRA